MSEVDSVIEELRHIRALLLNPSRSSMTESEHKLTRVVEAVRHSSERFDRSATVQNLIRTIRFLLENARKFWEHRALLTRPGAQYLPGGALRDLSHGSTFVLEL